MKKIIEFFKRSHRSISGPESVSGYKPAPATVVSVERLPHAEILCYPFDEIIKQDGKADKVIHHYAAENI